MPSLQKTPKKQNDKRWNLGSIFFHLFCLMNPGTGTFTCTVQYSTCAYTATAHAPYNQAGRYICLHIRKCCHTICTVRKAKSEAGPQHKGDGKFRHPYRLKGPISGVDGFFRSFYVDYGIFRHPRVLVLRHARLF
jgi:hypothetical protein